MSKLNISRNTFLEKEELNRLMKFVTDDSIKALVSNSVRSGGIVPPDGTTVGDNFGLEIGTNHRHVKLIGESIAYDTQGNRIFYDFESSKEILLPYVAGTAEEIWLAVEYGTSKIEKGTITLGANGSVTGVGTEFTKLFRGISTLVPNKIRIYERTKISTEGDGYSYAVVGTYEVTQTVDDNHLLINTSNTLASGDYVFSVVGAFSPGTYDDTREEEIYEYDYYNLLFYTSEPTLTSDQYILAKITVDDNLGTQVIEDLREDIFTLVDPLMLDRIAWSLQAMKGEWESMIISGCKSYVNYNSDVKLSLTVPSGYVMLGDSIYQVEEHTTIISSQSDIVYWEIYSDAGVSKARSVYSSSKLSTYYDFDQNYRTQQRIYRSNWNNNVPSFEAGFLKNKVSLIETTTTGQYYVVIDGDLMTIGELGDLRDYTVEYVFTVNSREYGHMPQLVSFFRINGTDLTLKVYDTINNQAVTGSLGKWDFTISKISKENY